MFPRKDGGGDPHASYHADGNTHQKSYDHKSHLRCAKPGASFPETVNLVTTGIAKNDARAINTVCRPDEFEDIFEIPLSDLGGTRYTTNISVDLTPPNGAVPWIVVTLSDTTAHVTM